MHVHAWLCITANHNVLRLLLFLTTLQICEYMCFIARCYSLTKAAATTVASGGVFSFLSASCSPNTAICVNLPGATDWRDNTANYPSGCYVSIWYVATRSTTVSFLLLIATKHQTLHCAMVSISLRARTLPAIDYVTPPSSKLSIRKASTLPYPCNGWMH